jgi:chorismate mutase
MKTDPALQALRDQIDAIDRKLFALLRERADVVESVRGVKGKLPVYIRPGREADMLRVLLQQPLGRIPEGLIHRLWREMIGAFTLQEGGLRVAVGMPEGEEGIWDYARDHFGSFTPMQTFASPVQALRDLIAGKFQAAVLPLPYDGDAEVWWRLLLAPEPNQLKVFYRIPFDGQKGNARRATHEAVVVGMLAPEETASDRTLVIIEWKEASRRVIDAHMADFPWPVAAHAVGQGSEPACSWVDVEGFRPEADEALKNWLSRHKDAIMRDRIAGSYPLPMHCK